MPLLKIIVEHQIEQTVIIDVPEDELEEMTYDDAVVNCLYDEFQPSSINTEIMHATVNGKEHYFK